MAKTYKEIFMSRTDHRVDIGCSGPELASRDLLTMLRAAAEPTRLRILALCVKGELTVSELVRILGQSQPRVSRHLRLLVDAGLLERFPDGSWVFYRLPYNGPKAAFVRGLLDGLRTDDPMLSRDFEQRSAIERERAAAANRYFQRNAGRWGQLRSLHIDEREVERRMGDMLPAGQLGELLDIGTGTARILEILAPRVTRGEGIDISREMLAVARANLDRAGLDHCGVRHADMYDLPFLNASFDTVTIHQVLHFAEEPARALAESARVLRPGGRVLVVDFAPHVLESLRSEHAHRRLGFSDDEVAAWFKSADLALLEIDHLPGKRLTVAIWCATKPSVERAALPTSPEVAGMSQ